MNITKYSAEELDDLMNSHFRFSSIYFFMHLSWSSLIEYSNFHVSCFFDSNNISWSQDLCFSSSFIWSFILFTQSSLIIQLMMRFWFLNHDIFNITQYFIFLSTFSIILYYFFNTLMLMLTFSSIISYFAVYLSVISSS